MKQFETLHVGDTLIYNNLRTLVVTAIKGDEAATICKETGVLQVHSVAHIKHCTLYQHTRYSLINQFPEAVETMANLKEINNCYCYNCGEKYTGNYCPQCNSTIFTEKPNSKSKKRR